MGEVKSLNNFKEDLIEGELEGIEKIENIRNIDEIYEFAIEKGYEFEKEELEDSDILDDIFDCVAGGKSANGSNKDLEI